MIMRWLKTSFRIGFLTFSSNRQEVNRKLPCFDTLIQTGACIDQSGLAFLLYFSL